MGGSSDPLRRCCGCRTLLPRATLWRIVRGTDGQVRLDLAAPRAPGRGAYVCRAGDCWQVARKRRSLDNALKTQIPGQFWIDLERHFTP